MKIWLFTTEYNNIPGGIATYVSNFEEMCENSNFELTIFFRDPTSSPRRTRISKNVEIIVFESMTPFSGSSCRRIGISGLQIAFEVLNVFEQACEALEVPDFIEVQDYMGIAYFLLSKKRALLEPISSIPVVITAHNPSFNIKGPEPYRLPRYFECEMERFCYVAADQIRYPSAHIKQRLESQFERPAPGIIIPHPVDRKRLFPSFYVKGTAGSLGYVGRLQIHKGIDLLLSAFAECRLDQEGFKLEVFGRDCMHPYLKTSMATHLKRCYSQFLSRGDIVFRGAYRRNDLNKILHDVDIVLLPYLEESFSYSFVEVLACGKLPLISAGGGQQELMHPALREKYVTDFSNAEEFKAALELVSSLPDAEREHDWDIAVRYVMEKCDFSKIAEQVRASLAQLRQRETPAIYPFVASTATGSLATDEAIREDIIGSFMRDQVNGLLSVVIPFYNMAAYVDATLVSVLESEYPNIEIIIVDDGSSDPSSLQALDRISEYYSCDVKIIKIPNGGLANARNVGVDNANGEFVAFLDPDDVVEPRYYADAVRIMNSYTNVDFVGCWTYQFDEGDNFWITFNPEFPYHLYHNMINSSSIVVKKTAFQSAGRNDHRYTYGMEDYNSTICLLKHGFRGVVIPSPLFGHRQRTGSMSNIFSKSSQDFLYRLLRCDHQDLFTRYGLVLEQLAGTNGFGALVANPSYPSVVDGHYKETYNLIRSKINENKSTNNWPATIQALEELIGIDPTNVDHVIEYGHILFKTGQYEAAFGKFNQAETMYVERNRDPFWLICHQLESLIMGSNLESFENVIPHFLKYGERCLGQLSSMRKLCVDSKPMELFAVTILKSIFELSPESSVHAMDFVSVALRNGFYDKKSYDASKVAYRRGGYWPSYHLMHAALAMGDLMVAREARTSLLNASDAKGPAMIDELIYMFGRLWSFGRKDAAVELWDLIAVGIRCLSVQYRKQLSIQWVNFGLQTLHTFFKDEDERREERYYIASLSLKIIKIDSSHWLPFFFYGRYLQVDQKNQTKAIFYLETAYSKSLELWPGLHLAIGYAQAGKGERARQLMENLQRCFGLNDDVVLVGRKIEEILCEKSSILS